MLLAKEWTDMQIVVVKEEIQERLYNDVKVLTKVSPARNYANITSLNKVSEYIFNEFKKLSCRPEFQNYKADGRDYRNVIASFGPEEGERIIVGAHYDVAGDQPGADDNASGIAGLLEVARILDGNKSGILCRIDLVAYTLEEPPYFGTEYMGSAIHARYLAGNNIPVKAMICLEMIGYFSESMGSQAFPDDMLKNMYPNAGNFIIVVGQTGQESFTTRVQQLMQENAGIDVQKINLPANLSLAGLSDHRNYWKQGYDAVMINDTSFLRNPHYHKKTDIIETLNFQKMAEVVRAVSGMILSLQLKPAE